MKCQILFSEKYKKNIINLSSAELSKRVVLLVTFSADGILKYFFVFPRKHDSTFLETICMKCQLLLSGKYRKNIINLSSAELANRVVNVN